MFAIACVAACVAPAFASGDLRTIALSGAQAPGLGAGIGFRSFNNPVLNDNGRVAFSARLLGTGVNLLNDETVYSEAGGGGLALVAREGDDSPIAGLTYDGEFSAMPAINDAGQTLFRGVVDGPGVGGLNNSGLFVRSAAGGVLVVARGGAAAPGAGGASYNRFFDPVSNPGGQVAFLATLSSDSARGVFSSGSGALTALAFTGGSAPGVGPGVQFETFLRDPLLSDNGHALFQTFLTGDGVTDDNNEAFYSVSPTGALTLLARAGGPAADAGAGVLFDDFRGPFSLNGSGQAAFRAGLRGAGVEGSDNTAVFTQAGGGGLALLAREGQAAPGIDGVVEFEFFNDPVLNDAGRTAFVAVLDRGDVNSLNDRGVYLTGPAAGGLSLLIREGDPVPGADVGVNLGTPGELVINAGGQIAFAADLAGPSVNLDNDSAIFATDSDGDLQLIVREGDTIDLSDDPAAPDLRTIQSLGFAAGSSNEDGRGSGFNDAGQVAFFARFDDDTVGLFVSDLLTPLPDLLGDFNADDVVNAADFVVYRDLIGQAVSLPNDPTPGSVELADREAFVAAFGSGLAGQQVAAAAVPEPAGGLLVLLAAAALVAKRRGSWAEAA